MNTIIRLLALCCLWTGTTFAQGLRVGAALRNISPNPLLPISGGVGKPKPAKEKKGDLFVRAMVFEQGGTRVAIVSVDNLGWPSALGNRSRAMIQGIPAANILIGATHTHSAPDAYGFPDETGKHYADLKYLDFCVKAIAEAVQEAIAKLEPAQLKINVQEAKGKIAYNYYAPALYDPRCGIIQALRPNGTCIATLVNYAVHPEVLGNNQGILSPDLLGPFYERIEEKTGGMALFMNGAQGGMVTADTRLEYGKEGEGQKEANTWEECQRIGWLLADEALRIVANSSILPQAQVQNTHKTLELPVASEMMQYILTHSPLQHASSKPNVVATQLNVVNIGPAQILSIPGEALPNIGYYLKRNMPTPYPFLFGLTNDAFGYILTKVDFNSFKRYEYISRTSLGEMTGEIFIQEALDLIQKSPKPQINQAQPKK